MREKLEEIKADLARVGKVPNEIHDLLEKIVEEVEALSSRLNVLETPPEE